jgi:hypothetical protein
MIQRSDWTSTALDSTLKVAISVLVPQFEPAP